MKPTASPLFKEQAYVAGAWRSASYQIPVINPATEEVIGTVPKLHVSDIEEAITSANAAWSLWRTRTSEERAVYLRQWHRLILVHEEELAAILTLEQGKPLPEARGEIAYAAAFVAWFAEEGKRAYGEIIPSPKSSQRLLVMKEPIGVTAAITPWNFPAAMITRKVAASLAAGCPVIVKPSEETPYTALALAYLAHLANMPAGVLSVVTGDARMIGEIFTRDHRIRKLSFTGSTEVGRLLMAQSAPTIKKLSLELGGNAPFIIFEDADITRAVEGLISCKFRNSGQTCISANRVFVHASIYSKVVELLREKIGQFRVGNGLDPNSTHGPLINASAVEKVEHLIADAKAKGAKLLAGGERLKGSGFFFAPTLLSQVEDSMQITQEEIFGPVLAVTPFATEAEVIARANATHYGLAAYFYTTNASRLWRVSEALEYGMVGANSVQLSNEVAPFGGVKQSGMGREGSHMGLEAYLETKYMCVGL